jgi:hypothetical protein
MPSIAQDAQRLSLLFRYGVVAVSEVISWADSQIAEMDSPPEALLELSTTSPSDTGGIISRLHRLSAGAEFWPALRAALPRIRDYVASRPQDAKRIANHFYSTATTFEPVPTDLQFLYRFDDAFCLAHDGTYSDREAIYRELLSELERFREAA